MGPELEGVAGWCGWLRGLSQPPVVPSLRGVVQPRAECRSVCRCWRTDLPRGACLLISISVEHDKLQVEGGVKAVVLTSQYLIEPSAMGRSKVTHICRADLRYEKPLGSLLFFCIRACWWGWGSCSCVLLCAHSDEGGGHAPFAVILSLFTIGHHS